MQSPIILKDNFLDDNSLSFALSEIKKVKRNFSREGYENRATLRDKMDPRFCGTQFIRDPRNILCSMWYTKFWNSIFAEAVDTNQAIYQHAYYTAGRGDQILLSVYGDQDYYGPHIDIDMGSIITAVLMLSFQNPPIFTGGSLVVDGEEFKFKNNRLIVFPSCFKHEVTKIENPSDEYTDQRFTLQYFCSAVPLKKPIIDESSNIQ